MASRDDAALLERYLFTNRRRRRSFDDAHSVASTTAEEITMSRHQNQHRLYVINRSGSGEAQYVLLNKNRTEIVSYGVRLETWIVIKDISNFGVAVVDNVLYVIGGYDIPSCRHLHRVVK